jgi:FKBP-type peptidyl-prolyl cis-trans isomerase SlpA
MAFSFPRLTANPSPLGASVLSLRLKRKFIDFQIFIMSTVKANDTVRVHYTGKLTNGEVFDDSRQREEPIEFTLGQGQIIPGFEKGMLDMAVNETKTLNIPVAEAYGERREDLVQEVPKKELPENIDPQIGMQLMSQTPDGQQIPLKVTAVEAESITVDANHPLAGEDLIFEVELVEIK